MFVISMAPDFIQPRFAVVVCVVLPPLVRTGILVDWSDVACNVLVLKYFIYRSAKLCNAELHDRIVNMAKGGCSAIIRVVFLKRLTDSF